MPTRRDILRRTTLSLAGTGICLTRSLSAAESPLIPAPRRSDGKDLIADPRSISMPSDRYFGWPTLTQTQKGELILVASGGREQHVCPFGRVDLFRSRDEGKNWTFARTIHDGPIDDRDAGIVETSKGTLLVTTFTSLAYVPQFKKALAQSEQGADGWSASRLQAWQAAHRRVEDGQHEQHLGTWMLRSTDNGTSWSTPYRVPLNSPHGPCQLASGALLYAGKSLWQTPTRVGVCISDDDGVTWNWLSDIPPRPGDSIDRYHELHAVQTKSGRVIVHIRNHNSANDRETLQTVSDDGGRSWTEPVAIGVWGLPSHLMNLADGRVLMTYGHRRSPLGIQARLSADDGDHWSDAMILYGQGKTSDLGYPSTVQLSSGEMLTAWYEVLPDEGPRSHIRSGRWMLPTPVV